MSADNDPTSRLLSKVVTMTNLRKSMAKSMAIASVAIVSTIGITFATASAQTVPCDPSTDSTCVTTTTGTGATATTSVLPATTLVPITAPVTTVVTVSPTSIAPTAPTPPIDTPTASTVDEAAILAFLASQAKTEPAVEPLTPAVQPVASSVSQPPTPPAFVPPQPLTSETTAFAKPVSDLGLAPSPLANATPTPRSTGRVWVFGVLGAFFLLVVGLVALGLVPVPARLRSRESIEDGAPTATPTSGDRGRTTWIPGTDVIDLRTPTDHETPIDA